MLIYILWQDKGRKDEIKQHDNFLHGSTVSC